MKRRILKLCLFLLLGALINIALAWTCVLNPWSVKERSGGPLDLKQQVQWWHTVAPRDMSEPTQVDRSHIPGVEQDTLSGESRPSADQPPGTMLIEQTLRMRAGLPLRSLHGDYFSYVRVSSDNMIANRFDWLLWPPAVLVSKKIEYQRPMLPLAPLWPGFAINTILYAGFVWLLCMIPGALRRRRRIKRGLCPKCGYDLRGQPADQQPCPECGWSPNPAPGSPISGEVTA